ncbi:MAG: peptidylprolyl isomerase [Chlorobium sp.]|jgi:peptidyl-prolyl cis-trans isomerase SurA|uniref:peptidylprolyl isomerase n=1 Tax=Chlorobium sp. TaxID=1095 RepID=UPI001DA32D82|nr:peptidylprolyl isomerase [Chlorobium sp.]MBN1278328.1 peptidylprolyl isomerase [Chlorobiaceae bacterium]MCF8216890.1 peptidylprolyl isomerase [Chlorobium sp.]MCF8271719.1 peptidylprolyl isomerase [Chlorobium sp.]MCF8288107.1 peptidylprolyl isomerase [Chlorobium sp.]MCF8291698.1 peptidylprolyl isomerase [Chlorobium sp.]
MKKVIASVYALFLLCFVFLSPASAQTVDRIVAVVGNEVLFRSELDERVMMTRLQFPELKNEGTLKEKILNSMIDQKVILAKAKIDSTAIDEGSLEGLVADRMKMLASRFSSKQEMESTFGKSSLMIRKEIRQELKNQQLVDALRRKMLAGVSVTYDETIAFYAENKAKLPVVTEGVSVSQILKYPGVHAESRASSREIIEKIQSELKAGGDFAALAKKYSQDPGSAPLGGDLGYVQRGELIQSFEDAAYALKEGQISGVVETRYGFHIIQLLNREMNTLHVRHILIAFDRSKTDVDGTIALLRSIRFDVLSGKVTFADMARRHSDDPVSARLGGAILSASSAKTVFPLSTLRSPLKEVVATLKQKGDISEPVKIEPPQGDFFFAIFQLDEKIPAHKLNPQQDYAQLEALALEGKKQRAYETWLQQLRKEVTIRISDI